MICTETMDDIHENIWYRIYEKDEFLEKRYVIRKRMEIFFEKGGDRIFEIDRRLMMGWNFEKDRRMVFEKKNEDEFSKK